MGMGMRMLIVVTVVYGVALYRIVQYSAVSLSRASHCAGGGRGFQACQPCAGERGERWGGRCSPHDHPVPESRTHQASRTTAPSYAPRIQLTDNLPHNNNGRDTNRRSKTVDIVAAVLARRRTDGRTDRTRCGRSPVTRWCMHAPRALARLPLVRKRGEMEGGKGGRGNGEVSLMCLRDVKERDGIFALLSQPVEDEEVSIRYDTGTTTSRSPTPPTKLPPNRDTFSAHRPDPAYRRSGEKIPSLWAAKTIREKNPDQWHFLPRPTIFGVDACEPICLIRRVLAYALFPPYPRSRV